MANFKQAMRKVGKFLKKNGYIFLIIICIAAIGTMIYLAVDNSNKAPIDNNTNNNNDNNNNNNNNNNNDDDDDDDIPTVVELSFIMPVKNGSILADRDYEVWYHNQFVNNSETHCGIDFISEDTNVYAVCDGVVETVYTDESFDGTYVVIAHKEGYKSAYCSLDKNVTVAEGDTVTQGEVIGTFSASFLRESLDGAHLHFELYKNGEMIDPMTELVSSNK